MTEPVFGLTPGAAKILQEMANEHRQRLPDVGRRTRRIGPQVTSTGTSGSFGRGCGDCSDTSGNLVVDLDGLMCSDRYSFSPMCSELLPITFEHSSGTTWDGGPGPFEIECTDESTIEITATLVVSGVAVGDVVITISDGTNTWTWQNDTAFIPDQPVAMRRMTGPTDCPCTSWRPYPCLTPLDAA